MSSSRNVVQIYAISLSLAGVRTVVAQPITLLVEDKTTLAAAEAGLRTYNLYVQMSAPDSANRVLGVGFSRITTDSPTGFYQDPFGTDTAPNPALCASFPLLCSDTFVTIGCKDSVCDQGATFPDPSLDSALFNCNPMAAPCSDVDDNDMPDCEAPFPSPDGIPDIPGTGCGGWYNADPDNGHGIPNSPFDTVLLGQFTVPLTANVVSGGLAVFWGDGTMPCCFNVDFFGSVPSEAVPCWDGFMYCGGCEGPEDCDDGNSCTSDFCDPIQGCFFDPLNNNPCDDGLFCNGADTCGGGTCSIHAGDPCAGGTLCNSCCNEAADNCFCPPGTFCGSPVGLECEHLDYCNGSGACLPGPPPGPCSPDGNPCTFDVCNSGVCTHPPYAAGTPCEAEGNLCTIDRCDGNGNCVLQSSVMCPGPVPPCDMGQGCNPATGMCQNNTPPSTVPCASSAFTDCDHPDTCSSYGLGGVCQENHEPNGTPCTPDGNPCTNDYCNGGVCTHPPNDGVPCDDGNPCTTGDTCQGGCVAGTPVDCNDNDPCTIDDCDPATGDCIYTFECASDADCDDGDPGTANACLEGCCVSEPIGGGGYALDIRDGKCPNKFKIGTAGGGDLKVYIAGDVDADVGLIDLGSIHLRLCDGSDSIEPSKPPRIKDKATPLFTLCGDCSCHKKKKDYIDDVEIKFAKSDIASLIDESVPEGASIDIEVYGTLLDGTGFTAHDCLLMDRPVGSSEVDG